MGLRSASWCVWTEINDQIFEGAHQQNAEAKENAEQTRHGVLRHRLAEPHSIPAFFGGAVTDQINRRAQSSAPPRDTGSGRSLVPYLSK